MLFTQIQLKNIAAWKPADESFTSVDPIEQYVRPAISAFANSGRFDLHIVDDGGLSNYYSLAVHPSLTKHDSSRAEKGLACR